jgi:nitroimidazol reductase NimA-like FMN-containing flavoprotein (pyridoxamine 5'-phosphate oxidase superfamily)
VPTDNALRALSENECRSLLATQCLGRIGLSVGALPAIYPVAYRMEGGGIVVRPGDRSELLTASHGGVVGFEVDRVDPDGGPGWSVLVVGLAKRVRADRSPSSVADDREHEFLLRIEPALISGRQIATRDIWL